MPNDKKKKSADSVKTKKGKMIMGAIASGNWGKNQSTSSKYKSKYQSKKNKKSTQSAKDAWARRMLKAQDIPVPKKKK